MPQSDGPNLDWVRETSRRNAETLRQFDLEEEQERIEKEYRRMIVDERDRENFRRKMREQERMPDLPTKQERGLADHRTASEVARDEWMANRSKPSATPAKPTVRKSRTTAPKATWQEREKAAKAKVKQVQGKADNIKRQSSAKLQSSNEKLLKNTPAFREHQHPRDRFGRFAVKTIKATGRAIKSTVKGVGKVVKRANAIARRNDALAHRKRKLDLHKQEVAAGLKKTRTTRRKRAAPAKKQGGLFGFLGGSKKRQVRRKR